MTIPGAPAHHWTRISSQASRSKPLAIGQLARPSATTAIRASTSAVSRSSSSRRCAGSKSPWHSASTLPTTPCGGPRLRGGFPESGPGEVDFRLGVTAPPEGVKRPEDSARADVEVLQRRRFLERVPFMRRPELLWVERAIGVGHDRADPVANAVLVPLLVGERLERPGLVELGHREIHASIAE